MTDFAGILRFILFMDTVESGQIGNIFALVRMLWKEHVSRLSPGTLLLLWPFVGHVSPCATAVPEMRVVLSHGLRETVDRLPLDSYRGDDFLEEIGGFLLGKNGDVPEVKVVVRNGECISAGRHAFPFLKYIHVRAT